MAASGGFEPPLLRSERRVLAAERQGNGAPRRSRTYRHSFRRRGQSPFCQRRVNGQPGRTRTGDSLVRSQASASRGGLKRWWRRQESNPRLPGANRRLSQLSYVPSNSLSLLRRLIPISGYKSFASSRALLSTCTAHRQLGLCFGILGLHGQIVPTPLTASTLWMTSLSDIWIEMRSRSLFSPCARKYPSPSMRPASHAISTSVIVRSGGPTFNRTPASRRLLFDRILSYSNDAFAHSGRLHLLLT